MKTLSNPRTVPRAWSSAELRQLRAYAQEGMAIDAIAARLRRSVSAIRNKAGMHGISLASAPRRAPQRQLPTGARSPLSVLQ